MNNDLRIMNKKFFYILTFSSVVLLIMMGCTLSMEEWADTEEDKGYNEVQTVKNDFFTMEYEYKKTTRSLTDSIQKYIVQVEADSIIWFMDNLPSEWRPKTGGYVVANCCELFPMGLMAEVLSVENTNGMIKVVTTEADLEDVFEDFNFDFDADMFGTNPDSLESDTTVAMSRSTTVTRSGSGGRSVEVVTRDWAMFKAIERGDKQRRTRATRASLDEVYGENVDKTTTETQDIVLLEDDGSGAIAKKLAQNKVINTIDVKLALTTKTTIHKVVKLKEKRDYTCNTTSTGVKVSAVVGHDFNKAKTDDAKKKASLAVTKMIQNIEKYPKFSEPLKQKIGEVEDLAFVVEFPIPGVPFGVVLRLTPVLDVKFGLYGNAEATFWISRSRTITDVVNGKKVKDENIKMDPPSMEYAVSLFGTFECAGGVEIFLGLGKKAGNKAVGIGAFLNMTLNLNLSLNKTLIGDVQLGSNNEFFSITGKGEVGGKVLTVGPWGEFKFATASFNWWNGYTKHFYPVVNMEKNYRFKENDSSGDISNEYTLSYSFKDLGMHVSAIWRTINKPVLAIYDSEDADLDKPVSVLTCSANTVAAKKDYTFKYKDTSGKPLYIIPGVVDIEGNKTFYPDYRTCVFPYRKPTIKYDIVYDDIKKTYDYVYQTEAPDSKNGYNFYYFALPFVLRNAGYINDYWDDWGVYYRVDCDDSPGRQEKGWSKRADVSLKDNITKSGKYLLEIRFATNYSTYWHNMTAQAYVYYVRKGSKYYIGDSDAAEFGDQFYKLSKKDKGDILLTKQITLTEEGMNWGFKEEGYKILPANFSK